jgi:type I restriction enzyme S subunit
VRGTTGKIAIAAPELAGANVTRGIVPVRFDPEQLLQRFGYYSFMSSPVQQQIAEKTYGAALQQINIRDIRKLRFMYPNLDAQKKIIAALDTAYENGETLQAYYRTKLADLDDLRQSLLARAFAGALT